MAITAKNNKNRMDYVGALDKALFDGKFIQEPVQQEEQKSSAKTEQISAEQQLQELRNKIAENKHKSEQADAIGVHTKTVETQPLIEKKEQDVQAVVEEPKMIIEPVSPQEPTIQTNIEVEQANAQEEIEDDDMFLALVKGERGVQRSIYFESDVYQYINAKSKKYGAKFSNIVNMLLKEAIYKNKK